MGAGRSGHSKAARLVSFEVVLTRAAKADVAQAARWYHERSVQAAARFLTEIGAAIQRVSVQPTAQPVVDAATGARRVLVCRFPYRMLYVVKDSRAVILAVLHIRRDEAVWRERLQ